MNSGFAIPAFSVLAMAAPAPAQESPVPAPIPSEHRLTPQQVEQVLAEAAARRASAEKGTAPAVETDGEELEPLHPIYGEVGFSIGTGGYRSAYGSAVYPVGQDGFASISLNFDHMDQDQHWDWGDRPPNR